jgi:regulator of sigma D
MSEGSVRNRERRTRTADMVDKLLVERKEMLALYCQLAGLEPYTSSDRDERTLRKFCQVLMDYMAFGHFEIYERIAHGDEKRADVIKVAEKVYDRVVEATEYAVAFNDKYDSTKEYSTDQLEKDLSILGEELAIRVEMEDKLVAAMIS